MSEATTELSVPEFLTNRRSTRRFTDAPITTELLDALIASAACAPAPHHSRPWRFAGVISPIHKATLAAEMGARWRVDLEGDGVDRERINELLEASAVKITSAPALILGCLTWEGLDRYPDDLRREAEWAMALLSLGAAVENLMLAATEFGLGTCWVAAPIFCPTTAAEALELPDEWIPQALILVGQQDKTYAPPPRTPIALDAIRMLY